MLAASKQGRNSLAGAGTLGGGASNTAPAKADVVPGSEIRRLASTTRVWPLTGREANLQVLSELLDFSGGHRGVVLAGAPGVGKTRLAREALAIAERSGATTRWAAASSAAASIPFGALAHLLPSVPATGTEGFPLLHRAIQAIRDLGGDRPVVVGVDDGHLLDDASATLVHHIAISGVASLVVTLRSEERAPDPVVALWKDQLVPRLEVEPLSRSDVASVVSAVLGGPLDSASAARFWQLTLGNPLFLREVVLGALDAGQLVEESGLWRWQGDFSPTPRLTELVRARLGRLSPDQRALVETVAFGEPLSASLAAALSSERTLQGAEETGVVTVERDGRRWEVRMAHPLYGEVVKADCPPMRARDVRRALVAAQAARGLRRRGDVLRQATLQVDADGTGDPQLLVSAAAQANTVAPKVAERMARAALSSGGGFPAQLALGMAFRCQGQPHQAQTVVARAAAEASTDQERVEAAAVLAQILFWDLGAADEAKSVLAEAPVAGAEPATSHRVAALRASFALFTGRPLGAIEIASRVFASSGAPASAVVHASAVLSHSLARCGRLAEALSTNERGRTVLDQAEGVEGLRSSPVQADFTAVLAHAELTARRLAGPLDDAHERASALRDRWRALPGGSRVSIARLLCGQIALARGRPGTAGRDMEAVVTELTVTGRGAWLYSALLGQTEALAVRGDVAGARRALRRAAAEKRDTLRLWEPDFLLAKAWTHAAAGELSRALMSAERSASTAAASGQSPMEALALHTSVRLGRRDRTVARRLRDLAQEVDSPLVAASAAHADAVVAGDAAGLDRAAADLAAAGAYLLAAEASAHAAAAHREAGRRASELASSRRAAELAGNCEGACTPALAQQADEVPLTPREREVAGLAAGGLSNRAIAERLVVSVRTVENHLDRVYSKLGVHSRGELAVALSVDPPAGEV